MVGTSLALHVLQYLYSRTAGEKAVYYRRVSLPNAPTYRPPRYRMKPQQALALLLEQGVPEWEALRRANVQSPRQQEGEFDATVGGPRPR
jgi:hypothetical protein